jgi:predicted XRE-type DNA-binding protein
MSEGVEVGSGNVFADLGIPNPDEHQIKADLALAIKRRISDKGLTQAQAATLMDETQPNVSAIVRGRLRAFSLERLMHHLNALGFDVEMMIRETPAQQRGRMVVRTVAPSQ